MDLATRTELRKLIDTRMGPCISIFMSTHRAGPETAQDSIRLKNLLREAEQSLHATGLRPSDTSRLLQRVRALVDDYDFWQHQSDGLAIFSSKELYRLYRLPLELPELAVVAERFHLKPLLSLFANDGQFYVLALSQNQVRLLQGTRYNVSEINLENVPKSLAEALGYRPPDTQVQLHTASPIGARKQAAVFHGHGGSKEVKKDRLLRYFRQVNEGVRDLLGQDRAPLVVAAVDYLYPIYRQANTYSGLMEDWIPGTPDNLTAQELHARAMAIVDPEFLKAQVKAAAKYRTLEGAELTSKKITEILPAACRGRVESLFVAVGVQQWGTFDPTINQIDLHEEAAPGDQDLLNLAAIYTCVSDGTVYAVPPDIVPSGQSLAAVFRY